MLAAAQLVNGLRAAKAPFLTDTDWRYGFAEQALENLTRLRLSSTNAVDAQVDRRPSATPTLPNAGRNESRRAVCYNLVCFFLLGRRT